MKVGVPKETVEGERRVALIPADVQKLEKQGMEVLVEQGAGREYHPDEEYEEAGAAIAGSTQELYSGTDLIVKVHSPSSEEIGIMHEGQSVVSFLQPLMNKELVEQLAESGVTVFSMDTIPRTGEAQSMDALTSMASVSGYKCAVIAADSLGKYLPMMTTAAGTTRPSKALVLGAGVAGLQAIATTGRLGAQVSAFDIRPETKEQVESLGATFVEAEPEGEREEPEEEVEEEPEGFMARVMEFIGIEVNGRAGSGPQQSQESGEDQEEQQQAGGYAQEQSEEKQRRDQEMLRQYVAEADVIITTAAVPGKKAPILLTEQMVGEMKPSSVVVDMAAETGGNCELTEPGEVVEHNGVAIHGPLNLPAAVPIHASQFYSRNVISLLLHLTDEEGEMNLDFEDEITDGCCITHAGEIRHEATREALEEAG